MFLYLNDYDTFVVNQPAEKIFAWLNTGTGNRMAIRHSCYNVSTYPALNFVPHSFLSSSQTDFSSKAALAVQSI